MLTRPHLSTWVTKGFKGLGTCAKCNRDSYKIEVGFISFVFVLLEDQKSIGMGVFVRSLYYVILYPYLPSSCLV